MGMTSHQFDGCHLNTKLDTLPKTFLCLETFFSLSQDFKPTDICLLLGGFFSIGSQDRALISENHIYLVVVFLVK